MVTNFKKSFLLLITAIFFTQSLILGCSTEVDSEVKKMEEEKPDVITVVKKTHSVQGIPESWETTDVYAYVYDNNANQVLIPVTVKDGVATFEADETYTKCVLVSLPKGTNVSAYTAKPSDILNADCQKSEVIDLTKDSLSFVLVTSDYIGTWNSLTDELVINEDGTFSLDIGNNDSADCAGIYVDTKTGVKASYSEKVDGTDVLKNIEFTKKEADVLFGSVNEKETYFVKSTNETPNLNGTWKNSDGTITTIINNESKKIYVKDGETEIWGTIVQVDNTFVLKDEESNVIGTGFVSAAGNAYIYNEATGTYEIFTRDGSATESDSKIPLKMFTVTYKSEFAKDDVQEKPEGTVLELPTPSYKGYRFDGWFDGKDKVESPYEVTKNVELTAKWTALYNVTYETNGTPVKPETVRAGTEITIGTTTHDTYKFECWMFDNETYNAGDKYIVNSDVKFVVKWKGLCTITYSTDGGETIVTKSVSEGSSFELPEEPTRDGYVFKGWYLEDENNLLNPGELITVTENLEIKAKWVAQYKYYFDKNDGNAYDVAYTIVDENTEITIELEPTRTGYVFKGWSVDETIYAVGAKYTITKDTVFTAEWAQLFTYYYDNNYGEVGEIDPSTLLKAEDNSEITVGPAIERAGYVFKGWSDGKNTYQPGDEYTITSNITFVAVWNELYYYYYDRNDDVPTDIDISSLSKEENGTELEVGPAIVRDGYVFKGWKVDEQTYQPGDKYTITKDTVFTAEWNPEYTYQFEGSETETVENGTKITIANALKAGDCTFAGWYDGTNTYQPGVEYEITDNVTFTAVWNVTVTYVSEYSQPEADVIKKGDSLVLPTPTYDGYSFGGWFDDVDAPVESPYTVDANITLTAKWTKDPVAYTISGVPTNETWTSGTVVAWVWDDDVETGFVVEPTFDKGTADYSFETAEDIKYCTIFVVDSMPSEPVTKDALTENSTAKSADMDISSGKAVFEAVYTIINVSDWYDDASAEIYISYEKDDEMQWINVTDNVEVAENGTLTIEFQSSDVITECTLSRFDPDDVDGLSDLSSVKPWNSVDLIFGDSCFTEFHDKFAIDSSKVYFKNAASFGIGIYVYFYNEGDSLPSTSNLSALTQMTAEQNGDGWYGAPADFTKEKVAFYGKDGNQNNSGWTIECDLIEGKIFFKAAGEKNTSGSNSGKYNMESFSSIKDALSKEVSKSTN